MRIAVIGTGIAGMVAARLLHGDHDLTVYESEPRIGGHTHTVAVERAGRTIPVDTGFIVCNPLTYPRFTRMCERLGVALRDTEMSFSVRDERSGLEYGGGSYGALFAQPSNALRPSFWNLLRQIARFNRAALTLLDGDDEVPLGTWLAHHGFDAAFADHYLVPLAGAIWSTDPTAMLRFPARFLARFMANHHMLQVADRPVWRTVVGGSRTYAEALIRPYRDRIRLGEAVASLARVDGEVRVRTARGDERYDRVVLACHADQALALIADPDAREREILGAFPYQDNLAILHDDASFLPRSRRAWSAWNAHVGLGPAQATRVAVTYDLTALMGHDPAPGRFLVTLNPHRPVAAGREIRRMVWHHPLFTPAAPAAQRRHQEINNRRGLCFAGAYWGWGFHEDGVVSALAAVAPLTGMTLDGITP